MDDLEIARRCADAMWKDDKASHALGIEIEIPDVGVATARMTIRDDMVNGLDVCHGGLIFALADTAFAFACNAHNIRTLAASCQVDFLRPAKLGDELEATAREEHRGRRSGYYTAKTRNQHGELVAMFRGRSSSNGEVMLPV